MKNLRTKLSYALYILLVAFLFTGCESGKIPEAPYKVTKSVNCEGCKAKYKYQINSLNSPKRYTEIITDQVFAVGDTLRISK